MVNKRDVITTLAIVFTIVLLFAIVINTIFFSKEDGGNEQELTVEKVTNETKEEGNSYELPSSLIQKEKKNNVVNGNTIDGGYDYSDGELEAAKTTAKKFIEKVLPFDVKEPLANVQINDEMLNMAFSDMLEHLQSVIKDNNEPDVYLVENIVKRELMSSEVVESDFYHPTEMYINILAKTNTTYTNGKTVKDEYFYNVYLERNLQGNYKVSSIYRFE